MKIKTLISSILLFIWANAATQTDTGNKGAVSGRIIDSQTQQGIDGVYVFFSNTTKGAQTSKEGYFAINRIPADISELVVAKAGYQTEIRKYESVTTGKKLDIRLNKIPNVEDPWAQTADEKMQHLYFIEKFKHIFLGHDNNAGQCELKNEQVLGFFYNEKTRTLEVYAHEPLLIENRLTGYRIVFVLENFTCFELEGKNRFSYKGHAFFMEMIPQLEGNLWNWQKNRYLTYRGSLPHFLTALSKNELAEEGFAISLDVFSPEINAMKELEFDIKVSKILREYDNANQFLLKFPDFLRIDFFKGESKATSWLYLNKQYAIFGNSGRFIQPFNPITLHGQWANQSFSLLLPRDYIPEQPETLGYNK